MQEVGRPLRILERPVYSILLQVGREEGAGNSPRLLYQSQGHQEDPRQGHIANLQVQWTPLIVATSGPVLSSHNNRWLLFPAVF